MEKSQAVIDILAEYYDTKEEEVLDTIKYCEISQKGYGEPAKRGVHAMHFPEDMGLYYIILCKGKNCSICNR